MSRCDEIRVRLAAQRPGVSNTSIRCLIAGEGLSWKKKTGHACELKLEEVQEWRQVLEKTPKSREDGHVLPLMKRSSSRIGCVLAGGLRLANGAPFPFSHRNTATLIAALCPEGIVASMIVKGPLDSDAFHYRVGNVLVPVLRNGNSVVCNNLVTHKIAAVRKAISSVGANPLFLPPYSPDLNPVEMAFAQIKSHLKRIAHGSQTHLYAEVGTAVGLVTPENASNHMRHGGNLCGST